MSGKKKRRGQGKEMTVSIPCPYGGSDCFACPLPDCQLGRGGVSSSQYRAINRLPYDREYNAIGLDRSQSSKGGDAHEYHCNVPLH